MTFSPANPSRGNTSAAKHERKVSMARTALLFAGAMAAISMLSDASAQSWSLGVEIGGPHYPPPPVYLYGRPPVVYAPAPPPVVYAPAPPVYYQPAPPVLHSSLSPEGIF